MTDEDVVLLGTFSEELMRDERFNVLCALFRETSVAALLGSRPEDREARETIYTKLQGVQDFLGLLKSFVTQRDATIARNDAEQAAPDDQDVSGIDIDN